jgi:hypothetical protein
VALQLYNRKYWFPSGTPAVNVPARVFIYDNNVFANLFADQAGTIPIAQPLNTDGAGFLTFWAEEGQYWVHIDEETFLIDAGLSEEQADLTTGIASGGELNLTANPQAVEISALVGYVVDNNELTSTEPAVVKVDEATQVVALDAAALLRSITYWLMDSAGTVVQQAAPPTPQQRRTHLALGLSLYDTGLGVLVEVQTQPVILGQPTNQLVDFMDALGPFTLTGNIISPNGVNLSFNKTAGTLFSRASNHFSSGILTDNPHESALPAQTPCQLRRILRTSVIPTPPAVTTVDPTRYDLNGVLTLIGGGTNTSTIQRVYAFATNIATAQIAVQYGQATFASLAAAVAAVHVAPFVPGPVTRSGALIGYICMIRTATNLSDPTQATFVPAFEQTT